MSTNMKLLSAATVLVALLGASTLPANTIKGKFGAGQYSLTKSLGSLAAKPLVTGNTYDFTFAMAAPLTSAETLVQLQALAPYPALSNEPITFDLYSGLPGAGTYLATSSTAVLSTLAFNPVAGNYYVSIVPSYVAVNKEIATGLIYTFAPSGGAVTGAVSHPAGAPTAVPEPGAWVLMMLGVAGVGGVARRARRSNAARTA